MLCSDKAADKTAQDTQICIYIYILKKNLGYMYELTKYFIVFCFYEVGCDILEFYVGIVFAFIGLLFFEMHLINN